MTDKAFTEHLDVREALIEAYLLSLVSREAVLETLSLNELREIELQRDILRHDVKWGSRSV